MPKKFDKAMNDAQARYIERNDIVVQVAKIIDPGAFETPWVNMDTGEELYASKRRYQQSSALSKASQILQLAARHKKLREALIDSEVEFWDMLGIPINETLREIVREKYVP